MMFVSAASYVDLKRVLKREGIQYPERTISDIDEMIRQKVLSELFGPRAMCRGPNGEPLIFIPYKGMAA